MKPIIALFLISLSSLSAQTATSKAGDKYCVAGYHTKAVAEDGRWIACVPDGVAKKAKPKPSVKSATIVSLKEAGIDCPGLRCADFVQVLDSKHSEEPQLSGIKQSGPCTGECQPLPEPYKGQEEPKKAGDDDYPCPTEVDPKRRCFSMSGITEMHFNQEPPEAKPDAIHIGDPKVTHETWVITLEYLKELVKTAQPGQCFLRVQTDCWIFLDPSGPKGKAAQQ